MIKFILTLALFTYLSFTENLKSEYILESESPVFAGPEDPEDDSTDALTVFSAKIKDKTIYLNWRVLNPKNISYFEVLSLNSKTKAYEKINEDRIKKDDYFEKSSSESKKIIYWYDYEEEPERDGVYFYKLKGYNSNGGVLFESDELKIGITGIRNFKLDQNKPNPFNPTTSISYELFEASHVKLKVFDLIGKEITTLVDENQASGTYTVVFDASKYSNLTSGIYFYKLETGVYTEVKKMILTK